MDSCKGMLEGIYQTMVPFGDKDRIRWNKEKGEQYTVKSYYAMLARDMADSLFQPHERDVNFLKKRIWDTNIPFCIAFFAWRAYWGRIQLIDKLNSEGMHLENECILREREEETGEHVLLKCKFSRKVWEFFLSAFRRQWTMPWGIREALGKDLMQGTLSPKTVHGGGLQKL